MVTMISAPQRQIQAAIAHLFEMSGIRFVADGELVSAREVFSECGVLPEIARLADSILISMGAKPIVAAISETDLSMFGERVDLVSPIHVLGVTALIAAAETILLESPLELESSLKEVMLDPVFSYLLNEKEDCPWAARMPSI